MTFEQAAIAAILAGMLAAFVAGRWRFDVVAVAGLGAAALAGVVPAEGAFAGFANPAVVTVAAILALTRTLADSGAVDALAGRLLAGVSSTTGQAAALCGLAALLSAFMNNAGALALVMPLALSLAGRHGRPPSLLLLPLSYATLLGGMTTLIGTPPNLLVSAYRAEATGEPFGVFAFAAVGVPLALLGVAYLALVGWRFLPAARRAAEDAPAEDATGAFDTELRVPAGSPRVGRAAGELETARAVTVHGIVRDGRRVFGRLAGEPLRAGDVLLLTADLPTLRTLVGLDGLLPDPTTAADGDFAEVVVATDSPIQGSTARTIDLRRRWGVTLVAAARRGRRAEGRLADARLSTGDVLLLHGDPEVVRAAAADLGCLPLADRRVALHPRKAAVAGGVFAVAVAAATLELTAPAVAFVLGVLALVAFRAVRPAAVYEAIDWPVIVLLAAMIPLGEALRATGTAGLAVDAALSVVGGAGPHALLALLLAATMALTPVLNNPATVAVMAPVALDLAARLGVSPDPFLIAVALGASCDFLTPFGHHNNALVMGPGGYRFADYARVGLGLEILILAGGVALIPMAWAW